MKFIKRNILIILFLFISSLLYGVDFNVSMGQSQSHQKNVDSFINSFTMSLGIDYFSKEHFFLRTNATYQQYKIQHDILYNSNYIAISPVLCFQLIKDDKMNLYLGIGGQSSILLKNDINSVNMDLDLNPINLGFYAQMGFYYRWKKVKLGFFIDACYYLNGVGKMKNETLPGVSSAQYLSLIIPLKNEK